MQISIHGTVGFLPATDFLWSLLHFIQMCLWWLFSGMLQWLKIAEDMGTGRHPAECLSFYRRNLQDTIPIRWSPEEDEKLITLFDKLGEKKWKVWYCQWCVKWKLNSVDIGAAHFLAGCTVVSTLLEKSLFNLRREWRSLHSIWLFVTLQVHLDLFLIWCCAISVNWWSSWTWLEGMQISMGVCGWL